MVRRKRVAFRGVSMAKKDSRILSWYSWRWGGMPPRSGMDVAEVVREDAMADIAEETEETSVVDMVLSNVRREEGVRGNSEEAQVRMVSDEQRRGRELGPEVLSGGQNWVGAWASGVGRTTFKPDSQCSTLSVLETGMLATVSPAYVSLIGKDHRKVFACKRSWTRSSFKPPHIVSRRLLLICRSREIG